MFIKYAFTFQPAGVQGTGGAAGPQGPQGLLGPKGEKGRLGLRGPMGPQGPTGAAGSRGQKGEKGVNGTRGPPGPTAGGVVYTRWGRTTCPSTSGTQLLYAGRAAWMGRIGGVGAEEDGVAVEGGGGADDCAGVAGVLDAV